MPVSPGIYVREFDFSQYARRLGLTSLALIGGASKGPLNVPTRITNEADLVRIFGKPLLTDYGLQSAVQFLKQGDNLLYVRVAHGALQASYPVPGTLGGTAAVAATGTVVFTASANPADGNTVTVRGLIPTLDLVADNPGAGGSVATSAAARIAVSWTAGTVTVRGSGKIRLKALPNDLDTVTINDGTQAAVVFTFKTTPVGATDVQIVSGDVYATATNLETAINAQVATLLISADDAVPAVTFEFDDNGSFDPLNAPVLIGATAADTMVNLISAISLRSTALGITARNTTVTVPQATLTNTTSGIFGNATVSKVGASIAVTGLTGGVDAIPGPVQTILNLYALNPGTWGNTVQVVTQQTTTIGAPAANFDLFVYAPVDDGSSLSLVERFLNLSLTAGDARFVESILTNGKRGEVDPSAYVTADVIAAGTVMAGTYVLGQSPGTAGTDGISGLIADDYIGTVSGQTATGLQALRNPETTEFNLIAVPGVTDNTVINAVLSMAAARGDFLYLIDTPFGLSVNDVVGWHNGLSIAIPNAPTAPINSNYAAIYWSWVQVDDAYSKQTVWLPPCGIVAAAMARTDRSAGPWFAVAGIVRGLVNGNQVEYSPTQADRDTLVGTQNRVNPIVSFQDSGLTIYGNRTTQRAATALDSVHVRRMLLHAEKVCATATRVLVFDPNDPITWRTFTLLVNEQLAAIKSGRGLEEFKVICDETTNPPSQRQNKTMRGKILVKPIDAAEIIQLDFAVFATGAEFQTNF